MRALGLLPACLLATAAAAFAQERPPAAARERAVYQIVINGRDAGIAQVVLDAGEVWMGVDDLTNAGLRWTSAREDASDGVRRVAMSSLVPKVWISRDDQEVTLAIDADAASFAGVTGLSQRRETPDRLRRSGGFLNYSATAVRGGAPSFASEIGVSARGGLFRTTVSGRRGATPVRGATTLSFDRERTLVRWEIGDTAGAAGVSAGIVPIAGVSISRQFGISAGFVKTSALTLAGATAVPATAEVYVNGQLVNRTAVEPGAFELRDLIAPTGAGDVQLVLRDSFGRVTASTTQFYRSPRVLRQGLHEFRYAIGAPRREVAHAWFDYGGVAALAEHRLGLTRSITIGGEFARMPGAIVGGGSVAAQSRAGEIEIGAGASRSDAGTGHTVSALYGFRSRRVGAQAAVRSRSMHYAEAGAFDRRLSPRLEADAAVSLTVGRGLGVSVSSAFQRRVDGAWRERSVVSSNFSIRPGTSVSLGAVAQRQPGGPRDFGALATVAVTLGPRTSLAISSQGGAASPYQLGVVAQQSLPVGPGIGYRVQARDGGGRVASAQFEAQGQAAQLEVRHDLFGGAATDSATVSGALAVIGGDVHLSRPITDAFALVRVSRIGQVRTYLSNQYVGRTNRRGEILVPSLSSYQANRISIDERDVPITFDVGEVESVVAPGLRGGSVVTFRVRELRLIEGRFSLPDGGDAGVSTATIDWPEGGERVAIGKSGAFAFERASTGRYVAHVTREGQSFACAIDIARRPSSSLGIELIGDVPCALEHPPAPAAPIVMVGRIKGERR